jgi:hypothetical protein
MIENDIKVIRKKQSFARTKTAQEIKTLSQRQTSHEKANRKQFQVITDTLKQLPTQEVILKSISDSIKIVVNGKIDHLTELVGTTTAKVDLVGDHLIKQDIAIEAINVKIRPVIGSLEWLGLTKKGLIAFGAVCVAIIAIAKVLQLFHII